MTSALHVVYDMQMNYSVADTPEFWRSFYQQNNTPWDLNQPAPPFVHFINDQGAELKRGKMAVIGCGKGHDAAFFGDSGFDVTGFDLAPEAIAYASQHYGEKAHFEMANLFDLNPRYSETFDYVVEHTLFCAISPGARKAYVDAVYQLLKPQGMFIAIFFAHHKPDGPPFKTDKDEVSKLFSPFFEIQHLEKTPYSIPERKDVELFGVFQKRNSP